MRGIHKICYHQGMSDEPQDQDIEETELPPIQLPKRNGPPCPMCDEPTVNMDGEYICFDCNGGMYGPGMT